MSAYIADTETSQQTDPEVIELATMAIEIAPNGLLTEGHKECMRFKPERKISCGARAVHHILDSELANAPPAAEAALPADTVYVIGHNVDFDWGVLGKPKVKRVCTLALARSLWPQVEGHGLSACMYRISEDHVKTRDALRGAHTAEVDVRHCYMLLEYFLDKYLKNVHSMEDLWIASEFARVPKVWAFGKFKGKKIEEADRGYLNWCLKQQDMDEYVKVACRKVLAGEY